MSISPSPLHPPESVRRFTSLKIGVVLLLILLLTLFGVQRQDEGAEIQADDEAVTFPLAGEEGRESLADAEAALAPATGDAMIELPGPPAFSILSDDANGIRLKGDVPSDSTRNQWMNAARLGAHGAPVSGELRVRRIDPAAAGYWDARLTPLVALMRERGIAEMRVRGDAVELFGQAASNEQADETLRIIRAQVPEGYRVLSRFNLRGSARDPQLALVGEGRDRPLASAADVVTTSPTPARKTPAESRQAQQPAARQRPANCPKSLRSLSVPVYFETNAAALKAADRKRLRQLGACLGGKARVRVTGHSDPRHTASYNKSLSERRARAVASGIIEGGFPAARVTVVGAGQVNKDKARKDQASLRRSRRVDIRITTGR